MERKKRRQIKNLNSNRIYINEKYLQIMFKKIKVHEELLLHTKLIFNSTSERPASPKSTSEVAALQVAQETPDITGEDREASFDPEFYHDIKTKKCNIL